MHNKSRKGRNACPAAPDCAHSLRINFGITDNNSIYPVRNLKLRRLARRIEGNNDIAPIIASSSSIEPEGNKTGLIHRQELHISANQVSVAHMEGRMSFAQGNKLAKIYEEIVICGLLAPSYHIHIIRAVKRVVNELLVAEDFFARIDERSSLGKQDDGLPECCSFKNGIDIFSAHIGFQTVSEAHIAVATDVADVLPRLDCPRLITIIDKTVINLRMIDSTYEAELDALFIARNSNEECALAIVIEGTSDSITHLIAEGGNARHRRDIGLKRLSLRRKLASSCSPTFSVNVY